MDEIYQWFNERQPYIDEYKEKLVGASWILDHNFDWNGYSGYESGLTFREDMTFTMGPGGIYGKVSFDVSNEFYWISTASYQGNNVKVKAWYNINERGKQILWLNCDNLPSNECSGSL